MSWARLAFLRRGRFSVYNPVFHRVLLISFAMLALFEVLAHRQDFQIPPPTVNLDPPFYNGCQEPVFNESARANAVIVMLARNSDVDGAVASVRSVQEQFNRHFGYPWVFLNDKPWTEDFLTRVSNAVTEDSTSGDFHFEQIPEGMWGYPDWIDQAQAHRNMVEMESRRINYAGSESYHHMCRFQSGFFYDHPALRDYKWYWRVEPGISFTCAITYDPFIEMEHHGKRYGYTIALWEVGKTVPSLFRKLSGYKQRWKIPTTSLWTALIDPSYLPWPLRSLLWWMPNRDIHGDLWNMCHFWSNFEIADLDFFRSQNYRDLFRFLDRDGGFYYERWGDASVHTLAVALLLHSEQVHHFSDFGYIHKPFQYCTYGSTPESLERGNLIPSLDEQTAERRGEEIGCNCHCDPAVRIIEPTCMNRMKQAVI